MKEKTDWMDRQDAQRKRGFLKNARHARQRTGVSCVAVRLYPMVGMGCGHIARHARHFLKK